MILRKLHKILIGALVVQVALVFAVLSRGDDYAVKKPEPLLAGFDAAKVGKLTVYGKDATKPAVVVDKRGASWVVTSAFDYPASTDKANELLASLGKLAVAAPIATQPSRYKQLRVDDAEFERKLVVAIDGKDTTLYVGGPDRSRRTAVRLGGDANVYAVSGIDAWTIGQTPRDWVDPSYVKLVKDELASVEILRDGKRYVFERDGDKWKVAIDSTPLALAAGESLDTAAIEHIVEDARTIDLAAPADPKRDASAPTATITLTKKQAAAPVVVDVIADGERYWVHDRARPQAVFVEKARLDAAVEVTMEKVVKKPEPAPAAPDEQKPAKK